MEERKQTCLMHAVIFFLYGGFVHVLFFAILVRRAYAKGPRPPFVSNPLIYTIVALAGGLSVTWLMLRLLEAKPASESFRRLRVLLRGCLYGVAATILTVAGASLAGGIIYSAHLSQSVWLSPFIYFMGSMEIGTYALGEATTILPVAFLYGAIGGVYVLALPVGQLPIPESKPRSRDREQLSVIFGILGLLFVLIPLVGLILGVLAIVFGVRAGREKGIGASARTTLAKIGIFMGSLTVFFYVFSFGVYAAALLGWLGNR